MGSETILFVGGYYEIRNPGAGQQVTKYYFAGTARIAMRKYTIPSSMAVEYLLGDHPSTSLRASLGSTSITADVNGAKVSEMRYKPWGEVRYASGMTPTKYQYTGQYSIVDESMGTLGRNILNVISILFDGSRVKWDEYKR